MSSVLYPHTAASISAAARSCAIPPSLSNRGEQVCSCTTWIKNGSNKSCLIRTMISWCTWRKDWCWNPLPLIQIPLRFCWLYDNEPWKSKLSASDVLFGKHQHYSLRTIMNCLIPFTLICFDLIVFCGLMLMAFHFTTRCRFPDAAVNVLKHCISFKITGTKCS